MEKDEENANTVYDEIDAVDYQKSHFCPFKTNDSHFVIELLYQQKHNSNVGKH